MLNRAIRGCVILIIAFMVTGPAVAKSKHPSISPSELSQPNGQKGKSDAPAPTENKRGTDEIPLTIKILPGQKTESQVAKEEYESHEKPQLERGLTAYTGWLAVFTAFLFIAAFIQVGMFYVQLKYMRAGIIDATLTAKAAQESANTAHEAFVADHRPWVSIDAFVGSDLTYDNNENAMITIRFILRNHGNSPAANVKILPKMIPSGPRFNEELEQRKYCDQIRQIPEVVPLFREQTLFPEQAAEYIITLMIARDEIHTSFQPALEDTTIYWPSIFGCVSYEFTFQKGRHLTEFRRHLRKVNHNNQNLPLGFDAIDGTVPLAQILLFRALAGNAVD